MRLKVLVGLGALLAGFGWGLWEPQTTQLSFLCVGQGDCAVFQHAGTTVVVDAGPARNDYSAGERMAAPELRRLGVDRIDLVLISHPDSDHLGGLTGLAKRYQIGAVAFPEAFRDRDEVLEPFQDKNLKGTKILFLSDQEVLELAGYRFEISEAQLEGDEDNTASMMLFLTDGTNKAILTGDAPAAQESLVVSRLGSSGAQIVKAGHHGSAASMGEELLDAARPAWVVFSCGRSNSYGHPSDAALSRARGAGAKIWRTDRQGTATFQASRSGFRLVE